MLKLQIELRRAERSLPLSAPSWITTAEPFITSGGGGGTLFTGGGGGGGEGTFDPTITKNHKCFIHWITKQINEEYIWICMLKNNSLSIISFTCYRWRGWSTHRRRRAAIDTIRSIFCITIRSIETFGLFWMFFVHAFLFL